MDSATHAPFHHIFSHHASHHFNKRMRGVLGDFARDIAHGLGDNLLCVVVGGTYGRGEGRITRRQANPGTGVWSGGESPLDDMDLLVLVKAPAFNQAEFSRVCSKYREILGIEIDVLGILTPSQVRRIKPDIHWHGIARSHKTIWGDPGLSREILSGLLLVPGLVDDGVLKNAGRAGDKPGSGLSPDLSGLNSSRAGLADEAFRLTGECMCQALSTLVLMNSPDLVWDGCFYVSRLDTAINHLGTALLLSAGSVPSGPSADRMVFQSLDPGAGNNQFLPLLERAYLDQHDMRSYAMEAGSNKEAVMQAWARYFGMQDWVICRLDADSYPYALAWKDRKDWHELAGLVHGLAGRTLDISLEDRQNISKVLSRLAGNFIQP